MGFAQLLNKRFFYATAVLMGTMVGVGIFGIPAAFARAGFPVGALMLAGVAGLTLVAGYCYGEVVLRTKRRHQLVGYTGKYLGPTWKRIIFFADALSIYGALLAYIIIAGDFLSNTLGAIVSFSPNTFSTLFFILLSLLVFRGMRTVAWVELVMMSLFIAIVAVIVVLGIQKIELSNLAAVHLPQWFLPYGVLLFAFAGFSSIPIQRDVLRHKERMFRRSITTAVLVTGALYLLFGLTVLGVSGDATSPDAISGLFEALGTRIVVFGSLFGVLAVATSYLMLGTALQDVFRLDYQLHRRTSWLLVIVPPFLLFVFGLRTFVEIIGIAGAVAIGLVYAVLLAVFRKAKSAGDRVPEYSMHIPPPVLYLMTLLYAAGIVYALFIR